jgi:hypothetical protein
MFRVVIKNCVSLAQESVCPDKKNNSGNCIAFHFIAQWVSKCTMLRCKLIYLMQNNLHEKDAFYNK